MLDPAVQFLICPHCGEPLDIGDGALRCPAGHSFDIARQGYVSLQPPRRRGDAGDSAEMVAARERFLSAGHFDPLTTRLAELAERQIPADDGCVVDVGAGTGHHLAAVLDRLPGRIGVALDASRYALRRAARAHDRIGAVGCDVWRGLPVADGAAVLALDVSAPRNARELHRILHPSGRLLVATPTERHLAELVTAFGLLTVDERKPHRLAAQLESSFALIEEHTVTEAMSLAPDEVEALIAMGPSAWHTGPDVAARVLRLPDPTTVTLSVTVGVYRAR